MNNDVAMGHCFTATKQSYIVVNAFIQPRNIVTSKRTAIREQQSVAA